MDSRGRLLWSTMLAKGMHVLNGCSLLPTHTCITIQHGQMIVQTTVHYVILNKVALHMAKGLTIEDHPSRRSAKNFHAHLALTLSCPWDKLHSSKVDGALECHITWVSGMEMTWRDWTDSEVFAQCLENLVTAEYENSEALNAALE